MASISAVRVAAPGFRVMPIATTCHIMNIPPHTAPPGMFRGSVMTEMIGRMTCFVPMSNPASRAIMTRSTVAIFARWLFVVCCISCRCYRLIISIYKLCRHI